MSKYLLVVNDHGGGHGRPFANLGLEISEDVRLLSSDPDKIGLVLFTGGSDVSPSLYGKNPHRHTFASLRRDMQEIEIFNRSYSLGLPLVGICRGGQFLCVMAGGTLVQDVTGHRMGTHPIIARYPDGTEKLINTRGDHHQMQYPWNLSEEEYEVLAWGDKPRSAHYGTGDGPDILVSEASEELKKEPDVVWYPKINGLAIQFHPEWMDLDCEAVEYVRTLVKHYFFQKQENQAG